MNILEIRALYFSGKMTKKEYISKMYDFHQNLFDYSAFLSETGISKIEVVDHEMMVSLRDTDIRLLCKPGDKRSIPFELLNFNEHESDELKVQLELIGQEDTVVDVGANSGWYSINIARNRPRAKIFAFEPIPATFNYLVKNIHLNRIANIEAHQSGISENSTQSIFYVDPSLSVNASLQNLAANSSTQQIECPTQTLDSFQSQHGLAKINFIKCDIEGAELLALKGARRILENDKPAIYCELSIKWSAFFNYHPNDLIAYLDTFNYHCFKINQGKIVRIESIGNDTTETNFLFLHAKIHSDKILQLS